MGTVTITTEEHVINSGRGTTVDVPLSQSMIGTRLKSGRPAIRIADSTDDLEVRFAYWTSDDGVTWSTRKTLTGYTTYVSADGWTFGTTFASFDQAPWVRFGVSVKNISGSLTDFARVTLSLEAKF